MMTNYLSDNYLPEMMTYAKQAQSAYLWMSPSSIDHVITAVLDGLLPLCSDLARSSVDETRMGIYEDKLIFLNRTISDIQQQYLPFHPQHIVRLSRLDNRIQRQPAGIIAGITDNLQPAAEVLFACITAIRTRNPIILSFHPSACSCSCTAAAAIRDLAVSAGAPDNCIQWLEENTSDMLEHLLRHPDITAMTASGAPSSVRQYLSAFRKSFAFACPSNAFCYIHQSADIHRAARQIILSRTFDNGLCNCTEQIICIDHQIYTEFRNILQNEGCYLASSEEITRLTAVLADLSSDSVNPAVIGQTPQTVASMADITIPEDARLIIMEMNLDCSGHPLLIPFLCPVIVLMPVGQNEQAGEKIHQLSTPDDNFSTDALLQDLPELPSSRSLVIHAEDKTVISSMSRALPDFSFIENAPAAAQSLTSQYTNQNGSRMDTDAMEQLLSHCRSQNKTPDIPHTFRLPSILHFQKGALNRLRFADHETHIAFLYNNSETLPSGELSIAGQIQNKYPTLKYRNIHVPEDMPAEKASDYLLSHVKEASPDCLIAIGNAQIMDTAKMLLGDYKSQFPSCGTRLILIPSIDGCHTAMLPFHGCHIQTTDILDTSTIIADSSLYAPYDEDKPVSACLAAMADAFDAWFSNHGNDLTDALSLQAICLFLTWMPELFNEKTRYSICMEHLQNASLLSGMAASHTGTGLSRIMAERLHCDLRIPMNNLQSILLPHIIQYNGDPHPSKSSWDTPASGFTVSDKLQRLYNAAGITADSSAAPTDIAVTFAEKIRNILHRSGIPLNLKACGIREKDYMMRIDIMARKTFEQLSTTCADANPRYPLIKELTQLYKQIYE
ncbi:MAG: iron-containing alcohol dehydrogenase [Coprococcus sp.]